MIFVRLLSSFIVGGLLNLILPGSASEELYNYQSQHNNLSDLILAWLPQIGMTLLKIVVLVNSLLIIQRALEEFGVLKYLTKPLSPFMRLIGLPKECDLLNHHLAVLYSILEDPLLFLSLGYSLPILIIPRFLFAIVVVWLRRFENYLKDRKKVGNYTFYNNTHRNKSIKYVFKRRI